MNIKIQRARSQLILSHPWWASLLLRLQMIEKTSSEMIILCGYDTACTDGKFIYYSINYINGLSDNQLKALLVHEMLHVGLLHILRRNERDFNKWNVACDHAVNLIAIEDGFDLPPNGLCDEIYKGLSAEEIYALLPEDSYPMPCYGIVIDGLDVNETIIRQDMIQSIHAAIRAGRLAGSADKLIDEVTQPPAIPWLDILMDHVVTIAGGKDDYSWSRPNRRGLVVDLILPSWRSRQTNPIAICIDTSASMNMNDINAAIAAIKDCIEQISPTKITIIAADAEVQSEYELEGEFIMPKSIKGGGGTDFAPALLHCSKKDCCAIFYFTDMFGNFGINPNIPVIWVTSTQNVRPPFGEIVIIN